MVNAGRRIAFWFEFASPYTYIAAERIEPLARAAGVGIEWKPFLLGPVLQALGTSPPAEACPWQLPYMYRDIERLCGKFGLPVSRPMALQRSGLLACRVTLAAIDEGWVHDFVRAVFRANFVADRDIGRREVIVDVLADLGAPVESVLERAAQPDIKLQLHALVEEAKQSGIFGSPSFIVGRELFWGQDRLEDALAWAGGQT